MYYGATSAPAVAAGGFYTTSFAGTENPLSETGVWTQGGTVGLDWTNVQKTPALCFGTQTAVTPPPFDDSIACLSGFVANHYAQGTIQNVSAANDVEVMLLLRFAITAHSATGYEIDITQGGDLNIVRWNGALNDFTVLAAHVGSGSGTTANGDIWYGQIFGTVITVKCNGTTITTYNTNSDTPKYSSGNPGLGLYRSLIGGTPSSATSFGWSSYTAGNL